MQGQQNVKITHIVWKKYNKVIFEDAVTWKIRPLALNTGEFMAHRKYRWLLEIISLNLCALRSR